MTDGPWRTNTTIDSSHLLLHEVHVHMAQAACVQSCADVLTCHAPRAILTLLPGQVHMHALQVRQAGAHLQAHTRAVAETC